MKYINALFTLALSLLGVVTLIPLTASATTYDMQVSPKLLGQIDRKAMIYLLFVQVMPLLLKKMVTKMTLLDANSNVIFFNERSEKEGGQIALATLMNDWSKSNGQYNTHSTNATFLYQISNINDIGVNKGRTLSLSNPVGNADGSWTFDIKNTSEPLNIGRYHRPVLLIDTWNYNRLNPV